MSPILELATLLGVTGAVLALLTYTHARCYRAGKERAEGDLTVTRRERDGWKERAGELERDLEAVQGSGERLMGQVAREHSASHDLSGERMLLRGTAPADPGPDGASGSDPRPDGRA